MAQPLLPIQALAQAEAAVAKMGASMVTVTKAQELTVNSIFCSFPLALTTYKLAA